MSRKVFDESIEDHEKLDEWIKNQEIEVNENVIIKKSEGKGIGIFYNCQEFREDKIELLRIPNKAVYNINNLKENMKNFKKEEDLKIIKYCLKTIVKSMRISETSIIIGYFLSFLIIFKKRIVKDEGFENLREYLNILMETQVGNLYGDNWNILEDFISLFKGSFIMNQNISSIINEGNEVLIEEINEELESFESEYELVTIEEYLQIISAVRSRTLEIPRSIETDQGETEEGEAEDYYVDVTLVPILDFVNHNNSLKNAYFDVDKDSQDIILYYEGNRNGDGNEDEEGEDTEVYISYDEEEDLHTMMTNYGFIPRDGNSEKTIELPILGYNGDEDFKITDRCIKLGVSCNIRFNIKFDKAGNIEEMKRVYNSQSEEDKQLLIFEPQMWLENDFEDDEFFEGEEYQKYIGLIEEIGVEDVMRVCRTIRSDGLVKARLSLERDQLCSARDEYVKLWFAQLAVHGERFVQLADEYEDSTGVAGSRVVALVALYRAMAGYVAEQECCSVVQRCSCTEPVYNLASVCAGVAAGDYPLDLQ